MKSEPYFKHNKAMSWRVRLSLAFLLILAVVTISVTNRLLTDRFTETTRNRA